MVEMIQSVQERKKSIHMFSNSYPNICRLQNTVPNPNIKIDNNRLEFVADRLKLEDWKPVLEALSKDKSLHFISIRSRLSKVKVLLEADTESQVHKISTPKTSPLFTSFILGKLTESLSSCLCNSLALTGLLLEKIPLSPESLKNLTQGLEVCRNLQQLSLLHTQLGDDGCTTLCHVLRCRVNLVWLNLTGCGLTHVGVNSICNMLKFQKLNRYGESWKQSLRYRPVNPNIMPGLRRLTLNHNAMGDSGVRVFVEALIDDIWLKALDLQHCEITMVGAEDLMKLVKENKFLAVVDIRGNFQVPKSLVAAVVQQLASNNKGTTPEFQWLPEDNPNNDSKRSTCSTSISRSTQRLLSDPTLASSGLSVLPSKARNSRVVFSMFQPQSNSHTRTNSAKRTLSANNTPRLPWNWNAASNPPLRRGNSELMIKANKKTSEENILLELQSLKDKLNEVSQSLEEERERRLKIERELDMYKQLIGVPTSDSQDNSAFQAIFNQFYSTYVAKQPMEHPRSDLIKTDVEIPTQDNLDFVIRTINENNHPPDVRLQSNKGELVSIYSADNCTQVESNAKNNPTKAQQLFETLLSN